LSCGVPLVPYATLFRSGAAPGEAGVGGCRRAEDLEVANGCAVAPHVDRILDPADPSDPRDALSVEGDVAGIDPHARPIESRTEIDRKSTRLNSSHVKIS